MSLAFPNTVLNTIVAEAIDALSEDLENAINGGASLEQAVKDVVKKSYAANKQICFSGDNYAEEWHAEAEQRGLLNLRTTPDALPWITEEQTVTVFGNYGVLNERELESRFEVLAEQYVTKLNIEAEMAASIARTLILPAAVRYLNELKATGLESLAGEVAPVVEQLQSAIQKLEQVNCDHPEEGTPVIEYAAYMRDSVIPAMDATREVADQLEKLVADDLWPLPKYEEMLFIK
jgi:glutamine synthetase